MAYFLIIFNKIKKIIIFLNKISFLRKKMLDTEKKVINSFFSKECAFDLFGKKLRIAKQNYFSYN